MGQGFERFWNRKPDYSSRDKFFEGTKQTKSQILHFFLSLNFLFGIKKWLKNTKLAISKFFSLFNKPILHHHHRKIAVYHIRKHHKKYIFWSAIWFLFIKLLITLFSSLGWSTLAQERNTEYIVWDGIISQYEQCDDSNQLDWDGCSSLWQMESWATCIWEPSICSISLPDVQLDNTIAQLDISSSRQLISPKSIISSPIDSTPPITLSDMDDLDILNHFYWPDSQFTNSLSNSQCSISNLNIVRLSPWFNTIPNFLSPNTLYLLSSWYYDNSYMINIQSDCIGLIWLDSTVWLHTTVSRWANIRITSWSNIILYNLILNWSTSSTWLIHTSNNYSIYLDSPHNTIQNISTYDTVWFSVYMENFQNQISNISRYDSSLWLVSDAVNVPIILPSQFNGDDIVDLLSDNWYTLSWYSWQWIRPFNLVSNSIFPINLNIYSIDYQIWLSIFSGSKISTLDWSNFTWILLSPKTISIPSIQTYFSWQNILSAFKISSDQNFIQSLNSLDNSQNFLVNVLLPDLTSPSDISLYHSYDWTIWNAIPLYQIKDSASWSIISFESNQFWQFAIIQSAKDQTLISDLDIILSSPTQTDTNDSLQDLINWLTKIWIPVQWESQPTTWSTQIKTPNFDQKISDWSDLIKSQTTQTTSEKDKEEKEKKEKKEKAKDNLRWKWYYENGPGQMIWNQPIDIWEIDSQLPTSIIIQSSGDDTRDIIELELSEGTFVYTNDGSLYTGVLDIPRFVDQTDVNIKNFQAFKIIQIPPDHPDLFFKNLDNNPVYVTVKIPTPNIPVWKLVVVNYSNDQTNRHYLTDTNIISIDGSNFAVFQTNHFTTFSIWVYSGTFTINNDDINTTSTWVTLNMNISWATHMRFGNTQAQRDSASWIPYSSTHSWDLEAQAWLHTVYAAFSGQWEIVFVEDDIVWSRDWNNDYFINDYFRSTNPSSWDIKQALYGDGTLWQDKTAYTKYWSWVLCNPATMNVIYVAPGPNTIPNTLSANTIYVLNGWDYIKTATITAWWNCIAIVWKNRSKLFQSAAFSNWAIYATTRSNIVIDNVDIDTVSNGTWWTHISSSYWIYFRNSWAGHTVNNVKVYDASTYWIYLNASPNNFINNFQSYNNRQDWIYATSTAWGNIIQNSQFFSNSRYWINLASPRNKINNVQSYNNLYAWITINGSAATQNVLNNSQTYNNALYWIFLSASSGTIINNSLSHSNNLYGLYLYNATSYNKLNNLNLFNNSIWYYSNNNAGQIQNYYYWDIKIFWNNDNSFGTKISIWWWEHSNIWWMTWSLYNTWEYICNLITRPDWFLYHPDDQSCSFRWVDGSLNVDRDSHSYIYWSWLSNQTPAITYSLNWLMFDDLSYHPDHKIAQINPVNNIWYIKFKNNAYFADTTWVQLYFWYDQIGSEYIITWDFVQSPLTWVMTSYSSKSNISLTSNTWTKKVYITFSSWSQSRWFVSQIQYIWAISNPIVEKYFGYNSFYTDNREYNFCDPRNITVTTVNPWNNTIPTPVANRIYILNSWNYISTATKALLECSVLAGSGDVFHFTNVNRSNTTITANARNIIVDNIKFDWKDNWLWSAHNANSSSIYSTIASNLTINDIDIYNHSIWTYTLYHKNLLINDVNSYNNHQWSTLSYGLRLHATANATLNNIKSFNNYSENIHVNNLSSNISLNNILSFNSRTQWISIYNPSNLVLNNVLLYNNNSN